MKKLLLATCIGIFIGQACFAEIAAPPTPIGKEKRTQTKGAKKGKKMGWWAKRQFTKRTTSKKGIAPGINYFKKAAALDPTKVPLSDDQKRTWDSIVTKIEKLLPSIESQYKEYQDLEKQLQDLYSSAKPQEMEKKEKKERTEKKEKDKDKGKKATQGRR